MYIGVVGALGRMGRTLVDIVEADTELSLGGATVVEDSGAVGRDLGEMLRGKPNGIILSSDPFEAFCDCEAIIDFSSPEASLANAVFAAQARIVHIIGTTGFTEEDLKALKAASRHATIIRAGNMSLGVNLLVELVRQAASALSEEYDIEIIEAHHNQKIDAPSGTALMLGEAAALGRGIDLVEMSDRGRDGITGTRTPGTIGFHAIRGGDIIGDHDVLFASKGERIVLTHKASDRALFANGAVAAAKWGKGKAPGEYSMKDVLGFA